MAISFFSFYMAIMWSGLFIIIIYLFRKKFFSISFISVSSMLMIYLLGAVRMALPFEAPFTKIIISKIVYNRLTRLMEWELGNGKFSFKIYHLLIGLWAIVSIVSFIHFLYVYLKINDEMNGYEKVKNEKLQKIMDNISTQRKRYKKVEILVSPAIEIPMSIGVFKKHILLPDEEYSDKQAYFILMHEYIHLMNGDQIVKLLVNMMQCLLWWNPFVHLLARDLEQILEIKCDLTVIQGLESHEKADYLETIIVAIKDIKTYSSISIMERFQIVSKYDRQKNSKARKILLYVLTALTLYLSYSFVLQSRFEAPIEDFEIKKGTYEVDMSEDYIYQDDDGNYWLMFPGNESKALDEQTVLKMIERGFQIKEKEKVE